MDLQRAPCPAVVPDRTKDEPDGVDTLLLHPDRERLITACSSSFDNHDHTVKVWDLDKGSLLLSFPHAHQRIELWQKGSLLSGGDNFQHSIWDLTRGQKLATFTTDGQILSTLIVGDDRIVLGDSLGHVHFLKYVAG